MKIGLKSKFNTQTHDQLFQEQVFSFCILVIKSAEHISTK